MFGSNRKDQIGGNCNLNNVNLVVFGNCAINIGHRLRWVKGTARADDSGVITIGGDCLFSAEKMIRASDGHAIFDAANKQRINPTKNVWIDNYVWLCHGSSVGKGCKIGTGTVRGQNAMGFGDLDSNCIYAGTPARKIRSSIIWPPTQKISDIPVKYR